MDDESILMRFRSIALIAALVSFALIPVAIDGAEGAASKKRCTRSANPARSIVYDTTSMTGEFTFDMKHCFPEGSLVAPVRVDLLQSTDQGTGTGRGNAKVCKEFKRCRITVSLDHPLVERADYKFRLFFEAANGNNRRINIGWMHCTSSGAVAGCDN